MTIAAIRWTPLIRPSGYPQQHDADQRRIEKHQEEYKAMIKMKKAQDKLHEIEFEIYEKKVAQNRLRLEIFQNRKTIIDVNV